MKLTSHADLYKEQQNFAPCDIGDFEIVCLPYLYPATLFTSGV